MMWIDLSITQIINIFGMVYITLNKQYFMQYIPTLTAQQMITNYIFLYGIHIRKKYKMMSALLELHSWSLDIARTEIRHKMIRERKMLGKVCIMMIMMFYLVIESFTFPIVGDEAEVMFIKKFIDVICAEWSTAVYIIFVVQGFFLLSHVPMLFWVTTKTAKDLEHQIMLLNEYIKMNLVDLKGTHDDDEYQNIVHHRLVIVMERRNVLRRLCNPFEESVKLMIIPGYMNAVITDSLLIYFVLLHLNPRSDLGFLMGAGFNFMMASVIIHYILSVSEEWNKTSAILHQCPWPKWNERNRKTFLLFLIGSEIQLKWSLFTAPVDYSLITKMAKTSYSIFMGLWNITHRIKM